MNTTEQFSAGATRVEREARASLAAGDFASACQCLTTYLAANPARYDLRCLLGSVYQYLGSLVEARACYEQALKTAPASYELSHNLGVVCLRLGDFAQGRVNLEQALALSPDSLPTLDELAELCQGAGDIPAALKCYERILTLDVRHASAYVGMAKAFAAQGWMVDAQQGFETALALEPENVEALNGLAINCKRVGDYPRALELYDRALALIPESAPLWRNKAMLYAAMGDHSAAQQCFRQLLQARPNDPDVHFGLGCSYLFCGQLLEGWPEYEYRWLCTDSVSPLKQPASLLPRWRGESVDRHRSGLIIYAEQGFGDGIQFSRYAALAAQRFGKVRLYTRKPLLSLFQRSFGAIAEVRAEVADEEGYTHHCPLMSLPLAFATTLESIPAAIPYLQPDARRVLAWRERLASDARFKVGVAWATGKRELHKGLFELSPEMLSPLFALPHMLWVSLNKEPVTATQQEWLAAQGVADWTNEFNDFDDTAALVAGLDLIVSVDTAVAHLAGALGKPVWLLNRAESEWRWLLERSDSPWYPSMRIFRQQETRQWAPVISNVAASLQNLVDGRT